MKKVLIVLILSSFVWKVANGWEWDKFSLNLYWNTEIGSHLNQPTELMKLYNSLNLKGDYKWNENVSLFFNMKKFYDSAYDVSGEYDNGSYNTATNVGDLWLRELFIDLNYQPVFVRIGKQQVVWGTADGVRVLDCINPGDSRYAYLDDASEYRIPLWMIRFEVNPIPDGNLQFLLIPDFEANINAQAGDVFDYRVAELGAASLASLPPVVNQTINNNVPPNSFDDGTYAFRWQHVVNGWEYTFNYKYGYEFYPSGNATMVFPFFTLNYDYTRINIFGSSFTKTINEGKLQGLTLRGEFMYKKDQPFPYGTDGIRVGNTTANTYTYVLGFDKYFFTDFLVSLQFIQFFYPDKVGTNYLLSPVTLSHLDEIENMATLKFSKDLVSDRLKTEVLIVADGDGDARISPKVSFEVNDNLWVYGGIHFFAGKYNTLFGEFEQDSMIYVGATLSF